MKFLLLAIADHDQADLMVDEMADHPDEPFVTSAGDRIHATLGGIWELRPVPSGAELELARCTVDGSIIAEGYRDSVVRPIRTT